MFLFDLDGHVSAFRSVEEAAAWMEPNDVLDGEYPVVFTLDGHVVKPATTDAGRVTLTVTDERDEASLLHWLEECGSRYGLSVPADDVLAVANESCGGSGRAGGPDARGGCRGGCTATDRRSCSASGVRVA